MVHWMASRQIWIKDPRYFQHHEFSSTRFFRRLRNLFRFVVRRVLKSKRPLGPPDWISTPHATDWSRSPAFSDAYQRAVDAVGADYRIPWRIQTLTWAAAQTSQLSGAIVELGTGRGFSMAAVRRFSELRGLQPRDIYCFDVFEDFSSSGKGMSRHSFAYASRLEEAAYTFRFWDDVHLICGDVYDTLLENAPESISLLHVDLNDAQAEAWALQSIWPRISTGGIVVLDDFANLGMESTRIRLSNLSHEIGFEILSLPSGQGLVIR